VSSDVNPRLDALLWSKARDTNVVSDSPSEWSGRASRSLRRELRASARAQENRELKMIQNPGMELAPSHPFRNNGMPAPGRTYGSANPRKDLVTASWPG
jgi:hypothetical protein